MAKTVSLTPLQGTNLSRFVLNLKFPDKVGEPGKGGGRQFASPDLSAIEEKLRALKKALKEVSPIWKDEDKLWFGKPEAYKAKEVPKQVGQDDELVEDADAPAKTEKVWDYDQTKMKLTTDVELNGSAARGLAWLLWLWLHPSSPHRLNIGGADELAWPIVEQLKAGAWMKEMLGLDKKVADEITFEDEKEPAPAPAAAQA